MAKVQPGKNGIEIKVRKWFEVELVLESSFDDGGETENWDGRRGKA